MKIYIAGSSKEIHRAERWIQAVRAAGLEITEDWAANMRAHPEPECTQEHLVRSAKADLEAVRVADVVWLLVPPVSAPSVGAWGELTAALGLRKRIVSSLPTSDSGYAMPAQFCIFGVLVEPEPNDGVAFEKILAMHKAHVEQARDSAP